MIRHEHRDRIENNSLLLAQARLLLLKTHSPLILLGDTTAIYRINCIIIDLEHERRRWLRAVGSTMP